MDAVCVTGFSQLFCIMARFLFRYRMHFLFWVLYFAGWTLFSVRMYHSSFWLALGVTMTWFLGQTSLVYLTVYFLMPRFLKPRRIWLFLLLLVGCVFCSATLTSVGWYFLVIKNVPSFSLPFSSLFWYAVMGHSYWVFLAIGIAIIRERLRNDRRKQRIEKEHIENELRFLKSQMNPHFLFNAINSIYVLIKKDPDLAEHTLARFSDMLRYQLYDCATDFIPIEKEITYLENYIRMEQLRKGPALSLDYLTDEEVRQFSIAPILLIPLVENAFKYVSSYTDRDNQIRIRLSFSGSMFMLECSNSVEEPGGSSARSAGGIGLENVRRRLQLLYPSRHTLDIISGSEYYAAILKLQII